LRRSYLYIPAIKEGYFTKLDSNNADAIIFDLEDSVSLQNKKEAREILQNFFNEQKNVTKEIFIRINSEKMLIKDDIKLIKKNE
jgi:citrate lyase subunit beta/citryl-CoA lyase